MIETEPTDQFSESPMCAAEAEHSTLDSLIVLARHKRFIMKFTLVAVVLAVIVALLVPNQYTAETIVLPPSQSSSLSSAILSQFAGSGGAALASLAGGSLGIKNTGEIYVSLFRSRTVEDAVIQRFGLMARYRKKRMADVRKKFEDRTTVVLGTKDGLIRITVRDRDAKLAASIANGYVEELRKLSATLAITEASQRRLFFQQQLLEAKNDLGTAEEAMKSTQHSTGVLQIDSQAKSLIEAGAMLRAQVVAKQVQIQSMRSFATDDNPELVMAKQQLGALQAQLEKLTGSAQEVNSFIVPKGKVPEAGMEYLRRFRELKYRETVYELIAKQFELAKLDEARQGSIVQVMDIAVPPDKKSFPPRAIIVVLVTLIALVIAVLCTFACERWALAKRNPEQYRRIQVLRGLLARKQ